MYGSDDKCKQSLVGKNKRKRPLGRPRQDGENNIRMNLKEI